MRERYIEPYYETEITAVRLFKGGKNSQKLYYVILERPLLEFYDLLTFLSISIKHKNRLRNHCHI
jgi:hypothetical protein